MKKLIRMLRQARYWAELADQVEFLTTANEMTNLRLQELADENRTLRQRVNDLAASASRVDPLYDDIPF